MCFIATKSSDFSLNTMIFLHLLRFLFFLEIRFFSVLNPYRSSSNLQNPTKYSICNICQIRQACQLWYTGYKKVSTLPYYSPLSSIVALFFMEFAYDSQKNLCGLIDDPLGGRKAVGKFKLKV